MKAKFKAREWWPLMVLSASLLVPAPGRAQTAQAPAQPAQTPAQQTPAQPGQPPATPAATRITLQQAIDMAIQHNHSLQAARTMILQNQAQETTANLRPNPTISGDTQFLPILEPSNFNANYFDNDAQFDIGVGYLFERGKKRQHRLQAAKDQTAVTMAQVTDNERTLTFSVASQFITALQAQSDLAFALQDLASFQNTVQISEGWLRCRPWSPFASFWATSPWRKTTKCSANSSTRR
jgi:outer membrane protein, heavy metal efflux system